MIEYFNKPDITLSRIEDVIYEKRYPKMSLVQLPDLNVPRFERFTFKCDIIYPEKENTKELGPYLSVFS